MAKEGFGALFDRFLGIFDTFVKFDWKQRASYYLVQSPRAS